MKLSLTLSTLITSVLLFQGCGDNDGKINSTVDTTITGKTTLSSGFRAKNKATVCLDENFNNQCDTNEPQTHTTPSGDYSLSLPNGIHEGDLLLAEGGKSTLPLSKNRSPRLHKYYTTAQKNQNINIMTTLIVDEMVKNSSNDYQKVIDKMVRTYDFDENILLSHPLEGSSEYLKFVSAVEVLVNKKDKKSFVSVQNKIGDENSTENNTSVLPSLEDINSIVDEYATTFTSFFDSLAKYYDDFIGWLNLGEIDENEDKTCTSINKYNKVIIFETNGKVSSLSLSVEDNHIL